MTERLVHPSIPTNLAAVRCILLRFFDSFLRRMGRMCLRFGLSLLTCFLVSTNAEAVTVRVGVYENPPKVFLNEDGEADGFFIELLQHIARKEDWQLEFVPGSWDQCLSSLAAGSIDLMPDVAVSEDRRTMFDFTEQTVLTNWAQVYLPRGSSIATILDLEGKQLAVLKGDFSYAHFRSNLKSFGIICQFLELESFQDVFAAIAAGEADAGLISRLYGLRFEEDYLVDKSAIICCPADLRFAAPGGRNQALLEAIDRRLLTAKADPRSVYFRLLDRWLGITSGETDHSHWPWIVGIAGVAVLAAVVILLLGKKIREKSTALYTNFRDLYQNAPIAYLSIGKDERIQICNNAAVRLIGCEISAKVIGKPILEIFADTRNGKEKARRRLQDFLRGKTDCDEFQIRHQKGTVFWVEIIANAIYGRNDRIVGSRLTLTDIDERKRLETVLKDQEELLRVTGQMARVSGWEYDVETQQGSWTEEAARVHTQDAEGSGRVRVGQTSVKGEGGRKIEEAIHKAIESAKPYDLELEMTSSEGEDRWVRTIGHPVVRDGKVVKLRGYIQDITEQRIAKEKLHVLNLELEERVRQRTAELQKKTEELVMANQRLQEVDRLKSVFLASMSHELRTPLNSIIGFTGLLLMEMAGELNPEQKKQLQMVKNSSAHLLSLINDILDISKIEAGKTELAIASFSLRDTITEVVDSVRQLAENKGLSLAVDSVPDEQLRSDQRRFRQVLVNLLSNAIKYSNKGEIRLSVRREKERVTVQVADQGIGIRAKDLQHLFQPFQQIGSSLIQKQEGTGLGLYLSQKLVNLLGGEISVDSEYGRGSRFSFSVPRKLPIPKGSATRRTAHP